jgi:hypothetical protein
MLIVPPTQTSILENGGKLRGKHEVRPTEEVKEHHMEPPVREPMTAEHLTTERAPSFFAVAV